MHDIQLRASALTEFLDCPRRASAKLFWEAIKEAGYELRRLQQNIGAAVGTGVHEGSMWSLDEKQRLGHIGAERDAIEKAIVKFKAEKEKGVAYDITTPDSNTAERQIWRQVQAFRQYIAPEIIPTAVEHRLEVRVTEDLILTGQPDVIELLDEERQEEGVRDLKAGKGNSYHGAQIGGYSLIKRSHGRNIVRAVVDWVPRESLKKAQPLPVTIEYDVAASEQLSSAVMQQIEGSYNQFVEKGYDPSVFLPNPSSSLCSRKFCPAWGTKYCTYHKLEENND